MPGDPDVPALPGRGDGDLEPVGGQSFGKAAAPLDHGHRGRHGLVQVQVVDLGGAGEPVGVGVHQVRAPGQRRVHPGDHERRRGDRPAHPEAGPDALDQGGLARSQPANEDDQVAGPEQARQPPAEGPHRVRGRDRDGRGRAGEATGAGHADRGRPPAATRASRSVIARLTSSGYSRMRTCPAPGTQTRWAPGIWVASSMPSLAAIRRSFSPTITVTGILPRVPSAPRMSHSISAWQNLATTSMGVFLIICSRNVTVAGLTSPSPNPISRVVRNARSAETRRPRSTSMARLPLAAPFSTVGSARANAGRIGAGIHGLPPCRPRAAVETSTAPATLVPNRPGYWSARAMMVIPPMEWPTRTTGAGPGAAASITALRSAPSWPMLPLPSADRPDRPWSRWSQKTSR